MGPDQVPFCGTGGGRISFNGSARGLSSGTFRSGTLGSSSLATDFKITVRFLSKGDLLRRVGVGDLLF